MQKKIWSKKIVQEKLRPLKTRFICATGVLWVQKQTLQSNVPDANSGIMSNALSAALHYH